MGVSAGMLFPFSLGTSTSKGDSTTVLQMLSCWMTKFKKI